MAAVIVVFVVWFALVAVLAAGATMLAPVMMAPEWLRSLRRGSARARDGAASDVGRIGVAALVVLAMWSVVIIIGWLLGLAAHGLQDSIDWPAFRWWQRHHLDGAWSTLWWKLTDIGAPRVTLAVALAGALLTMLLYRGRTYWWAPAATLVVGYFAERYSQMLLKVLVHRGHPPTTLGTWPSGGMARVLVVYGLLIYFVVSRFWPDRPRAWALGWSLLGFCASVQGYARLNNLEHWTTDVVGGALYGVLLLAAMIIGYSGFRDLEQRPTAAPSRVAGLRVAATRADGPVDRPGPRRTPGNAP